MSYITELWHGFEQKFEELRNKIHPELHAEADALAAEAKKIAEVAATEEKPVVAEAVKATVKVAEEAATAETEAKP